ncbi:hypothetical protein EDD29_3803 [Actinocorallia herbida]|uniref:Uncharacterized protein n=1 Tax=Actinocorallia herbida TaxID=58109 RepID=A0A3N1CY68_9ACTN|nr:SAV_2336 N-terminal domain-related protein [Actinocorallia herbida]ROO86240.1 hypothetical protein EDD29_3803 [Actinocorallia herbida]
MIEALAKALARVGSSLGGPELTADEIADILLLTARWPTSDDTGPRDFAEAPASPSRAVALPGEAAETLVEPVPAPHRVPDQLVRARRGRTLVGLERAPRTNRALLAGGSRRPPPGAIRPRDSLALAEALTRFKRLTGPGRLEVDVEATIEAIAHTGGWVVVTHRPPARRSFDLALVVDEGLSLGMWEETASVLSEHLLQSGAFKSVTRWTMRVEDGAARLRIADGGPGAHTVSPDALIEPSGRRIVLVMTDAVGDRWYGDAPWRALELWARAMPTALLHMLPQRYWPDTAVGEPYALARATRAGEANIDYLKKFAWWASPDSASAGVAGALVERSERGVVLPVVGLDPRDLARWAASAAGGAHWVKAITTSRPVGVPAPSTVAVTPEERVRSFRHRASPGALRLAQALSHARELNIPLTDVLQRELIGDSGFGHRAEVLVSGLVEVTEEATRSYRFVPEAVGALQEGVTPLEQAHCFETARHALTGGDPDLDDKLDRMLRDDSALDDLRPEVRPFVVLARDMAAQIGVAMGEPARDREREAAAAAAPGEEFTETPAGSLREVLAACLARLEPKGVVSVLHLDGAAITTHVLERDGVEVPRATRAAQTLWRRLESAADPAESVRAAVRRMGEAPLVVVVTVRRHPMAGRTVGWLREERPDAMVVFEENADVAGELAGAVENEPLRIAYDLVTLEEAGGVFTLRPIPLFERGARPGETRTDLPVRTGPAREGVVLAVLPRGHRPGERFVAVGRARGHPGGRLFATLVRPGEVAFSGAGEVVPESRGWETVTASVPRTMRAWSVPTRVVLAVELSGPAETVAARLRCARRVIGVLGAELLGDLTFTLIAYGQHVFGRDRRRGQPDVLDWPAVSQDAAVLAIHTLEEAEPLAETYRGHAMVEDALARVAELGTAAVPGRDALVLIGDGLPHPPQASPSDVLPCPERHDWQGVLTEIVEGRPGLRVGAVTERPTEDFWREIGQDALARPATVDVREFCADLGLVPAEPPRLMFPIRVGR